MLAKRQTSTPRKPSGKATPKTVSSRGALATQSVSTIRKPPNGVLNNWRNKEFRNARKLLVKCSSSLTYRNMPTVQLAFFENCRSPRSLLCCLLLSDLLYSLLTSHLECMCVWKRKLTSSHCILTPTSARSYWRTHCVLLFTTLPAELWRKLPQRRFLKTVWTSLSIDWTSVWSRTWSTCRCFFNLSIYSVSHPFYHHGCAFFGLSIFFPNYFKCAHARFSTMQFRHFSQF